MPSISGVTITSQSQIAGINVTSISAIVGISTANIPGWPSSVSCETVTLGYSDGRRFPPEAACTNPPNIYEWDDTNQILYYEGGCGTDIAESGYYSDGRTIYFWDGRVWNEYGPCSSPSYFDLIDIFADDANQSWSYINTPLLQSLPNIGIFRFVYDSTPVSLYMGIFNDYQSPTQGEVSNIVPKYYGLSFVEPTGNYFIQEGQYLNIGCAQNSIQATGTFPVEIQGNFGNKNNPLWQSIGTFNVTIIV